MDGVGKIVILQSKIGGQGLVSLFPISKYEQLVEISFNMIKREDFLKKLKDKKNKSILMNKGRNFYIRNDERMGWYCNHSCKPNSEIKQIGDAFFIFALTDIEPGEEITVDYGKLLLEFEQESFVCNCGNEDCRETMNFYGDFIEASKVYLHKDQGYIAMSDILGGEILFELPRYEFSTLDELKKTMKDKMKALKNNGQELFGFFYRVFVFTNFKGTDIYGKAGWSYNKDANADFSIEKGIYGERRYLIRATTDIPKGEKIVISKKRCLEF